MKPKTYITKTPKSKVIKIKVDLSNCKVPDPELLYARLKNKAVTFEDKRFKKPKYKTDLTDY